MCNKTPEQLKAEQEIKNSFQQELEDDRTTDMGTDYISKLEEKEKEQIVKILEKENDSEGC